MKNDFFDRVTKGNTSRDNIYDDNYNGEKYVTPDEEYYEEEYLSDSNADEEEYEGYEEYEEETYSSPKKRSRKSKTIFKKILSVLLLFVVATIVLSGIISIFLPTNTNVLIMATDEANTRTDTIMVAGFNKKTKSVSLLSVPRDSFVTVSDESYAKMNEEYPEPGSKSMKINAIHHFGGEKHGVDLLVKQVEDILDININYYIKVNFEAFKYIIDAVGGIDFYVPQNMEYHDPVQNLHISLQEGMQHLNGAQAEQVVRFRSGYANQDLGRVSVQQEFMKACISQVLSVKNLVTKPGVFLNVLFNKKYVDTDLGLFSVLPYAFQVIGIDTENIKNDTLPGQAGYAQGQSVYFVDEEAAREISGEFFKN